MYIHYIWMQEYAPAEILERLELSKQFFHLENIQVPIRVWSEKEIIVLIAQSYPQYLSRFIKTLNTIQRCDIARAFILHAYGGLYMDIDFRALPKIKDFFNDALLWKSEKVIVGDSALMGVNNAWIYSNKGNDFWYKFLEYSFFQLESPSLRNILIRLLFPTWEVISSTGPGVYYALKQYLEIDSRVYGEWGNHGENSSPTWFNKSACTAQTLLVCILLLGWLGFLSTQLGGDTFTPSSFFE